jgi:hypothetical protein
MVLVAGEVTKKEPMQVFAEWFVIDPIFGHVGSVKAITLDAPWTILVMWMAKRSFYLMLDMGLSPH